jgi:HNH/Endo VII superfamily nuclease toxins
MKNTLVYSLSFITLLLTSSLLLQFDSTSNATPLRAKLALFQSQDNEAVNCDEVFSNRTLAFNAAKTRAKIPLSQNFVDQWNVGNDIKRQGVSNNYLYIKTDYPDTPKGIESRDSALGAMGMYHKYETAQGPRVVVDHTSDPKNKKHFHAGQPKGDIGNKLYDFRKERYATIGGSHHYCYN